MRKADFRLFSYLNLTWNLITSITNNINHIENFAISQVSVGIFGQDNSRFVFQPFDCHGGVSMARSQYG